MHVCVCVLWGKELILGERINGKVKRCAVDFSKGHVIGGPGALKYMVKLRHASPKLLETDQDPRHCLPEQERWLALKMPGLQTACFLLRLTVTRGVI